MNRSLRLTLGVAPLVLTHVALAQRADSTARRDSIGHLAPIVVSGTRLGPEITGHAPGVSVTTLDVARIPAGPSRITDALGRLPGLSLFNDQGNRAQPTLEVRGFSLSPVVGVPQGISVFLDGVRINEPDAQEVNFDLIPAEAIESANLVRGATPIFGKNTLGGALNVTTIRGTTPRMELGVSAGSFGLRDAHAIVGGMLGAFDAVVVADASTETGYQAQSGSRIHRVFATVGRRDASNDLALSLLRANNELFEAGSLPQSWIGPARRANYTGGDFYAPDATHVSLRETHTFNSGSVLRAVVFARRDAIEQFNVNVADANTRAFITNTSVGGTAEWQKPLTFADRRVGIALGLETLHSNVRYRVLGEPTAAAPVLRDDCDAATGECENAHVPGDDAAAYAQLTGQMTDRLSLTASLRGDAVRVPFRDIRDPENDGTSVFTRMSPRAAASYQLSPAVNIRASIGSAFRAPAALELACAGANAACPLPFSLGADPPLQPVVAINYEVGGSLERGASTQLDVSAFRTDVRNDIVFAATQAATGFFENIARTRRAGVEASGSVAVRQGVRIVASYTFVDATYQSTAQLASVLDSNVVHPGSRMALSPRHRGSLGIDVTHATQASVFTASLATRAVSAQFLRGDEANHASPLPGYAIATARIGAERSRFSISLDVDNVLDRRYSQYGVFAENPRGAFGGQVPDVPRVERFLTPAYPRTVSVSVELHR